MTAARSDATSETIRIFEKWGLRLGRNSPKEFLLTELLKLLENYGFQIERNRKSGSHYTVVFHPDLKGHQLAPSQRIQIPIIHNRKRETVTKYKVQEFVPLITYLRQTGDYDSE